MIVIDGLLEEFPFILLLFSILILLLLLLLLLFSSLLLRRINEQLGAVQSHGLSGQSVQFLPVKLGGSGLVLDLGVVVVAIVLPEEGARRGVAPALHLPDLLPSPVGIQLGGPHEGQVDAQ